ncbi:MAG: hypothetical protein AAB433_22020 [Nitrospirota bacterium]
MISAYNQSGLRRCGCVIAISAAILCLCFVPMAQADVTTEDILSTLSHPVSPPPGIIEFSNDVAVKQVLQRMVRMPDGSFDDAFARRLGFDFFPPGKTEAAVQQASTLFPISVFLIGLKQLQQYNQGLDPLKLLASDNNWLLTLPPHVPSIVAPSRFIFPIAVPANGQKVAQSLVRLLATFSPIASTPPKLAFEIKSFGSAPLVRLVDKWRRNPNATGPIVPEYFLMWIPALDRYYLGRLRNKDLLIKAITDDLQVGLKEGEEDIAKEVLLKLKAEALTINADDPDAPPR